MNLTTGGTEEEVQVQLIANPVSTTPGSVDWRRVMDPTEELIAAGKVLPVYVPIKGLAVLGPL